MAPQGPGCIHCRNGRHRSWQEHLHIDVFGQESKDRALAAVLYVNIAMIPPRPLRNEI